jgi:hypothetical protein
MKTQMKSLTIAIAMFGSLAVGRSAMASTTDHVALAAKYDKLAATQQEVINDNLNLKAESRKEYPTYLNEKSALWSRYNESQRHFDAVIDAAAKEQADLQRYAKWHRLEADGSAAKVDSLIAAQQTLINDTLKVKAENHVGYVNEKVTPSSRYAEADKRADALVTTASSELADLQGFAQWHQLAEAGAAAEVAKLSADQQAVVAEHEKMKMDNRVGYRNEKVTPSSRYAEMDKHCDGLIAAASQQLSVLQEFAQR